MTVMLATGTAMFSMVYFILLETDRFGKLRTAFDSRPWRNRENMYLSANLPVEVKPIKSSCPFSAKAAKGTCPICSTCASRDGYHHGDPKALHNTVGIAMIEYGMARKAAEREDNPVMGRLQLDTLINYRGNYLFGTISPRKGATTRLGAGTSRIAWHGSPRSFLSTPCCAPSYSARTSRSSTPT